MTPPSDAANAVVRESMASVMFDAVLMGRRANLMPS